KTSIHTGKGRHLYFRYPLGLDIRNAQDRDDVPGIDWRGNGGYVCAPPSEHPDGGNYAWRSDSASEFDDAPDWVIKLVTSKSREAKSPEVYCALIDQAHQGSDCRRAIAKLYGYLVRRYVDPFVALKIAYLVDEQRNEPPLGHAEVTRICNDIANR